MDKLIFVGIGGFIGSSVRYMVSAASSKLFGSHLPYGTLILNVAGGVLIGLIMELSINTKLISPDLRLFLTTGILGGLTTFSTFSYETMDLFSNGRYLLASTNILLNVVLSLVGVVLGKISSNLF